MIEDKLNQVCAFDSIANRHREFKGKDELVQLLSNDLNRVFKEALTELNNIQTATAALAYLNSETVKF